MSVGVSFQGAASFMQVLESLFLTHGLRLLGKLRWTEDWLMETWERSEHLRRCTDRKSDIAQALWAMRVVCRFSLPDLRFRAMAVGMSIKVFRSQSYVLRSWVGVQ